MTAAVALTAAAAVLGTLGAGEVARAWAARRRRRPGAARARPVRRAALALLAHTGRLTGARAPRDLETRLAAAGVDWPVQDVMAVKAGATVVALVAAIPVAAVLPGRLPVPFCAAMAAAGFLAPDAWLLRRRRRRARAMEDQLADVLDLLRVAVGAGLPTGRALSEVSRRHPGVLATELRTAADRMRLGAARAPALAALAGRCPADGVEALVVALQRADRHGAPLAPTLAAQALDARSRRAGRTAEAAAKASPKIQLVVALLLVPSVLLLVAAALAPALLGA